MSNLSTVRERPIFRTVMLFVIIFCVALILIMVGRRNDAITQAQYYQAGVVTADEINTAFEGVGGKLIKRHVDESDLVKQGDLLLEIDDSDLKISLTNLNAQIAAMQAQIKNQETTIEIETSRLTTNRIRTYRQVEQIESNIQSAKATLERTSKNYNRYQELAQKKAVSISDLDNARNEYISAQSTLDALERSIAELTIGATDEDIQRLKDTRSANGMNINSLTENEKDIENLNNVLDNLKANLDSLLAQREQIELNLSRTKLYAPCDGKVLEVLYQEGEIISANASAVLIETDRLYYDVYISELAAVKYKAGDEVVGKAIALNKDVKGIVRFVQASPSFADIRMTREQGQADLTSYQMRIYVEDLPELLVGMTVEIENE